VPVQPACCLDGTRSLYTDPFVIEPTRTSPVGARQGTFGMQGNYDDLVDQR